MIIKSRINLSKSRFCLHAISSSSSSCRDEQQEAALQSEITGWPCWSEMMFCCTCTCRSKFDQQHASMTKGGKNSISCQLELLSWLHGHFNAGLTNLWNQISSRYNQNRPDIKLNSNDYIVWPLWSCSQFLQDQPLLSCYLLSVQCRNQGWTSMGRHWRRGRRPSHSAFSPSTRQTGPSSESQVGS